jgi:predicted nucleic acid-binding protein
MTKTLFLDASYAIALISPKDSFYTHAQELADELESLGGHLVTTRAVLLEIGNALSARRLRYIAVRLLETLEADSAVEIISLSDDLYAQAFELYKSRPDKDWGLIDCVSFVVMEQRGITEALTADHHFEQAGFIRLLKS